MGSPLKGSTLSCKSQVQNDKRAAAKAGFAAVAMQSEAPGDGKKSLAQLENRTRKLYLIIINVKFLLDGVQHDGWSLIRHACSDKEYNPCSEHLFPVAKQFRAP